MFGLSHKQMAGVAVISLIALVIVKKTPLANYIPV